MIYVSVCHCFQTVPQQTEMRDLSPFADKLTVLQPVVAGAPMEGIISEQDIEKGSNSAVVLYVQMNCVCLITDDVNHMPI